MERLEQTSTTAVRPGLLSRMRSPILGPMLAQRGLSAAFGALGVLQVVAGVLHLRTFPCPMLQGTGIPCPGCGASRACGAVLRGDWHDFAHLHLLAPAFLIATGLFVLAALLSSRWRKRLAAFVARVERRTAVSSILLLLLLVYWIARLLYAPTEFTRLMRG